MKNSFTGTITILMILLPFSVYAQLQFTDVAFWPTDKDLGAIAFYDSSLGWIAGASGVILKTTNGGISWTKNNNGPINNTPSQLLVIDSLNLILGLSTDSGWYKSSNGGETWAQMQFPSGVKVLDIQIFNSLRWIAAGNDSLIMKTNDGGVTWDFLQYSAGSGFNINNIFFINESEGWYGGGASYFNYIFHTSNGGVQWDELSHGPYFDIRFLDSLTGFARGWDDLFKTTDGGNTWFSIFQEWTVVGYHIADVNHIYVTYGYVYNPSGTDPTIKYTSDGGASWEQTNYEHENFRIDGFASVNNKTIVIGTWGYIGISEEPLVFRSLTGDMFTGIYAFKDKAIVVGYAGELYWIKEEKNLWEKIDSDLSGGPYHIIFLNDSVGFIIGPQIWRSLDGGKTWGILNNIGYAPEYQVDKNNNLYVKSYVSDIYRTSDYGETWHTISFPIHSRDFYVFDSLHLWVSAYTDFYKTTDGGLTWNIAQNNWITGCQFFNPDSGYGFTDSPGGTNFSLTRTGGNSWETLLPVYSTPNYIHQVQLQPEYFCILIKDDYIGPDETIYPFDFLTIENDSVKFLLTYLSKEESQFSFYDRTNGWIAAGRQIFRVKGSTVSTVDNTDKNSPDGFELLQNYPNPFNPSTIIEFSIPVEANVKLSIYNILGEELKVLINNKLEAGLHKYTLDASGLPSGVYFYGIKVGGFTKLKKLVLLK